MRTRSTVTALLLAALSIVPAAAAEQLNLDATGEAAAPAGEGEQTPQTGDVEELRRRVDVLAAEVEKLRSGEPEQIELTEDRRRALGLAPSGQFESVLWGSFPDEGRYFTR